MIDTTSPARAAPWMALAWSELGVREGVADETRIVGYSRTLGHSDVTGDDIPWCAAFVGAMLERAGQPSTRSLRARSYLDWGEATEIADPGVIAVFSRGASPTAGHVGFVVAETVSNLIVLGGNQSDAVTVASFPKTALLGLRHIGPDGAQPATSDDLFATALAHVLAMEGGFTDDPEDPGGPTNLGITLSEFARHRSISLTASIRPQLISELKRLSVGDVAPIYIRNYWQPSRAADLPTALAVFHFDCAVNHGVTGAARMLQVALGVDADGEIGPITLGAAFAEPVPGILARYADVRRSRYRSLPHFPRFGRGWLNRTSATLKAAADIATRFADPAPPSPPALKRKAASMNTDISANNGSQDLSVTPKWWGQSLTIWGVIVTTLSTVLPAVGPLFGFDITAEMIRQIGAQLAHIIEALGGVIGIILTIAGRLRAVQPLTRRAFEIKM